MTEIKNDAIKTTNQSDEPKRRHKNKRRIKTTMHHHDEIEMTNQNDE